MRFLGVEALYPLEVDHGSRFHADAPVLSAADVDSVTTLAPGGDTVTPGKRVQAEAWEGGDKANILKGLHAFVEVPKS